MRARRNHNKNASPSAILALVLVTLGALSSARAGADATKSIVADSPPLLQAQTPQPLKDAVIGGETHLLVGRSLVFNSPTRIKRVSIADPNIVDAIIISPNQILVNAKTVGSVTLVLWDERDQSQSIEISVELDIAGLKQQIRDVFPRESVNVGTSRDTIVISGAVSSKEVGDRILQLVSTEAAKVINLTDLPPQALPGEVQLSVKFAEVDRAALNQFGINFLSPGTGPGPRSTIGTLGTQQFGPPQLSSLTAGQGQSSSSFTLNDLLNVFIFRPDIDLGATIRNMQQENLLQILAEPNLITQVGKEANFLAGGEFPFPVVQGGIGATAITVQFKEFGVRLSFTPTITPDGKIHLKVQPEVSALDFANALTISGFTIPALSTRRVQSEMDLSDGQSFAIAGLMDDRITKTAERIPILADLPALGHFFRSWSYDKSKTELLVVVTPRIVPVAAAPVPAGPSFPEPFLGPVAGEESKPGQKR